MVIKFGENDIVNLNKDVEDMFQVKGGKIRYCGGSFIVGDGNGVINSLMVLSDIFYVLRGTVIGNVFDNPELVVKK